MTINDLMPDRYRPPTLFTGSIKVFFFSILVFPVSYKIINTAFVLVFPVLFIYFFKFSFSCSE